MAAILQAWMNGQWVDIPAIKGKDGFSPIVKLERDEEKIIIAITDAEGEKTVTLPKGEGDMKKSVYDTDNNGSVDNADKLGGEEPSAYRKAADQIDYDTEIKNKPVIVNTVGEYSNAVSSKAVKTYVDEKINTLNENIDALAAYPKVQRRNVPPSLYADSDTTAPFRFGMGVDGVGENDLIEVFIDYGNPNMTDDKATYREAMRNAMISTDSIEEQEDGSYIIWLVCDGEFPTELTNMYFLIINHGEGVAW